MKIIQIAFKSIPRQLIAKRISYNKIIIHGNNIVYILSFRYWCFGSVGFGSMGFGVSYIFNIHVFKTRTMRLNRFDQN